VNKQDKLKVRVLNAKFYEKQDVFSVGDPFVVVKFGGEESKTKVISNTKTPTFNEGII
jgi:Ca2+-dependent lipid-binding protein